MHWHPRCAGGSSPQWCRYRRVALQPIAREPHPGGDGSLDMDTARVGGRAITTDAESADAGVPEDVRHAVMTAVYDELTRWGPGAVRRPDDVRTSQKIDESVVTKYWGGDGSRLALEALLYWSNDVLTPAGHRLTAHRSAGSGHGGGRAGQRHRGPQPPAGDGGRRSSRIRR